MTYNTRFEFQTKKYYNSTGAFDNKIYLQASETHAAKSVLNHTSPLSYIT